MKKVVSLFALVVFVGMLNAQELRNSVRLGYNRSFFSTGDNFGNTLSFEYSKEFNERFALVPRLRESHSYAIKDRNSSFDQLSNLYFDLSVRVTPFRHSFKQLKIDIGPYISYETYTLGLIDEKLDEDRYNLKSVSTESEYSYGFIGGIGVNVFENNKIYVGLKAETIFSLKGAFSGESWQTGIYVGFKL